MHRFITPIALFVSLSAPSLAFQGCPGQELFLRGMDGAVHRVDNYATSPSLTQVSPVTSGVRALAAQPGTGRFYSCGTVLFSNFLYVLDAAFGIQNSIPTTLLFPNTMDFAADGRLFVSNLLNGDVNLIDPVTAQLTLYTSNASATLGMAVHPDGSLYMALLGEQLARFDPGTGTTTTSSLAGIGFPDWSGLEIDCDGTTYLVTFQGQFYSVDLQTLTATFVADFGFQVVDLAFTSPADGANPVGTNYCGPAVPNAGGLPGTIRAVGSEVALDNDVTLIAEQLPPNQFGLFVTSQTQGLQANLGGGLGTLCLGGSIGRFNASIGNSGTGGSLSFVLDLQSIPMGLGTVSVMSGETWHYQCWVRDLDAGTPSSNLTDALTVTYL